MSASDVMDFSALDTAANTTVETPVETTEQVETPATETVEGAEKVETPKELQTDEEKAAAAKDEKITPSKARAALKAWKESNPENKVLANELNNTVGRAEAFSKVFPGGVKEATEFKQQIEDFGGVEGIKNLHEQMQAVNASDELLYAGSPELIDNVLEDLKAAGHPEALGKITDPLLNKLYEHDRAAYNKVMLPRVYNSLSGMVEHINAAVAGFDQKNPEAVKVGLTKLVNWYNAVQKAALEEGKAPEVNPEVERLKTQLSEKEKGELEAFKKDANTEATRNDNKLIVTAMSSLLKGNAFFKEFPKETLQELGKDIRTAIYRQLNSDKAISTKVNGLLKARDKGKAVTFWNQQVEKAAPEIAKKVIKSRYPGYDRTPAKTTAVKTDAVKTTQTFSNTKPVYVAQKPAWEAIDWTKDPNQVLYITGKAFLRSGKLITWKK